MEVKGIYVSKMFSDIKDNKVIYDDNEKGIFVGHTPFYKDDKSASDLFYHMIQWLKNDTI